MNTLTLEEKRIRLAQACGLNVIDIPFTPARTQVAGSVFTDAARDVWERCYPRSSGVRGLPDYFGDISAALGAVKHAVTELLTEDQVTLLGRLVARRYAHDTLSGSDEEVHYAFANMLAALVAEDYGESLGQALGLWKEGE